MKKYLFGVLLMANTSLYAQVNKEIYKEADVVKSDKTIIYSDKKFNTSELDRQLQKGSSTVKGKMYARARDNGKNSQLRVGKKLITGKRNAINESIYLIPYNEYVRDYIRLKHSSENPKKKVFVNLHDDAFKYRLEGITNSEGNFTFPNVKPGKYYVFGNMVTVTINKKKYYSNGNVATNTYGQVIAEGYSSYTDSSSIRDYTDNIVEVKADGQTVFVNVTNIKGDRAEELNELIK